MNKIIYFIYILLYDKKNIKIDISSIQYWNVRSNKKTPKKNKKTKIEKLIKKNVSKTTKHTGRGRPVHMA
jgi:hypothetical protein